MKLRLRRYLRTLLVFGIAAFTGSVAFVFLGNDIARAFESDAPSQSVGSTKTGSLVKGKRLPTSGANFRAYSRPLIALGRNSLHAGARDTVLAAYAELEHLRPEVTYVYAECSWPNGGRLRPHVTHRNGLSIDFMVPVVTGETPSVLKTHAANKYGYALHFDAAGWCEEQQCSIDFDAMAAHLHCLAKAAEASGLSIWRVIFAPDLQPHLFTTDQGKTLRSRLTFSEKQSWVRHDEHYHVDFHNLDGEDGQQLHSAVLATPSS